jgi:cytoskeleton protein RodZ
MSDNKSTDSGSPVKEENTNGPLAGQRLADARRANDISISEIAKELHLDEPKVQALEENQFDVFGAPVFAKGHLRKYAELVGVPIDDILADYYKLNRATGAPPIVGAVRRPPPRDISLGPWIGGVFVIIVVSGILYWWFNRDNTEIIKTPGALEPYAAEDQVSTDEGAADVADAVEEQDDAPAEAESQSVETQVETPAETPTVVEEALAGEALLVMTFSGDCWTEVTDANGSRLYFGLGQDGQTISRSGVPPLGALFGDHNNVSVTINGTNVPLSGDGRRGNMARVTIDSP